MSGKEIVKLRPEDGVGVKDWCEHGGKGGADECPDKARSTWVYLECKLQESGSWFPQHPQQSLTWQVLNDCLLNGY